MRKVGNDTVTRFTVADDRSYKRVNPVTGVAEKVEQVQFFTCNAWNDLGHAFKVWKRPGDLVQVRGEMVINETEKGRFLNVQCFNIEYLVNGPNHDHYPKDQPLNEVTQLLPEFQKKATPLEELAELPNT